MTDRWRLTLVFWCFVLVALGLVGRLFYWQIVRGADLSTQAKSQHTSGLSVQATRGNILSSDESGLAVSSDSWVLYAFLPDVEESPREIANELAPLTLDDPPDDGGKNFDYKQALLDEAMRLEGQLNRSDVTWVSLKRGVNTDLKHNIEALTIKGIGFDPGESRLYPESSSSAHVLGFVGKTDDGIDQGYFGLEGYYDLLLSGKDGYVERESNAVGVPLVIGNRKETSAIGGVNLITHIDKGIQYMVEQKLEKGIELYEAISGTIIVMRPKDGAILAMASFPYYDPREFADYDTALFKNPSISNTFEPGSIFKPIVMAAGFDAQVIKPETKCDICDQPVKIGKYTIRTWNNEYTPDSTMIEVLKHSDNIGMVFISQKLGKDKTIEYIEKFGFGAPTGIDLQGEAGPSLRDRWGDIDVATSSFGQGIAVTPIQMINAINTIARGGVSVTPQVVDQLSLGSWSQDIDPVEGERVISEKAAELITQIMVEAAEDGEAKWTATRGFGIAGKTGTAQIPVDGHYDEEKTIASFVGFAPYDDPKFVMLVTLREPQSSPWASETAAPLWFNIAGELFPYLGISPR